MTARSGNPAKAAAQLKISQVGDFKKRLGGIFELPSGLVVRLRNPGGMNAFIRNGSIPNSLMTVIQGSMNSGKSEMKSVIPDADNIDPQLIEDMTQLMDSIALQCVVEPKLQPIFTPTEEEPEPDDDLLYVNELPDEDKSFIFQWVSGGTSDLEEFRKRQQEGVADLATEPSARPAAKRVSRAKPR